MKARKRPNLKKLRGKHVLTEQQRRQLAQQRHEQIMQEIATEDHIRDGIAALLQGVDNLEQAKMLLAVVLKSAVMSGCKQLDNVRYEARKRSQEHYSDLQKIQKSL